MPGVALQHDWPRRCSAPLGNGQLFINRHASASRSSASVSASLRAAAFYRNASLRQSDPASRSAQREGERGKSLTSRLTKCAGRRSEARYFCRTFTHWTPDASDQTGRQSG
ncbi:hypothetical protein KCP71_12975 [Salmonella enterica subsp. enterica]|nr:hypothetical protein KCP71_12975 [Salmonella enterica subsp. enterica]